MQNIFTNNQASSENRNIFANNNQTPVNLFKSNQPQNANNQNNQNTGNQLPSASIQQNLSANSPIPTHPLIQDSLQEKNSFIKIRQKIKQKIKLTQQEFNFVTKKGLLLFKKDEWKANYFKNSKTKEVHLGLGPEELIYRGQIPRCNQIDSIWNKIIKHFAFVCDTNEMNGYFLIKPILREYRPYQKLYRPKNGLGNKVFEPNWEEVKSFYQFGFQGKNIVNKNGLTYQKILQKLVINFNEEWRAYMDIIELTGIGNIQSDKQYQKSNEGNEQDQLINYSSRQQSQSQPGVRFFTLKFEDLEKQNIVAQLWKTYKQFAMSSFPKPESLAEKEEDIVKQKVLLMKRTIFARISHIITSLLTEKYSQEMIMEKQPLPVVEAINFISKDIETVQMNNLIEPHMEEQYIETGLGLILAGIPFGAFILKDLLLKTNFSLESQKTKYQKACSAPERTKILEQLLKVKIPQFKPLKIWAKIQIRRVRPVQISRYSSQNQEQKQIDEQEAWEEYFAGNFSQLNMFDDKKWKFWVGLWLDNLSMETVVKNKLFRNLMLYYCKRTIKGKAHQFFALWDELDVYQSSFSFKEIHTYALRLPQNPTQQQRIHEPLYRYPRLILKYFEIYTVGRFLKTILQSIYAHEALKVFTTLLTSKARPKYNYTHQLLNFMETNKPEEDEKPHIIIAELLKAVVSQLSTTFKIKCGKKLENQSFLDYSAFEVAEYMQDESDSCENEIKFLCELVKKNVNSLGSLEGYVFDTVTHLDVGNEAPGLRTCVFLCKVLQRMNFYQLSNIKCLRYLITAIDSLFNCEESRTMILYAISIVFPFGGKRQEKDQVNNRTLRTFSNKIETIPTSASPAACIMHLIENSLELQGQEGKQIKKLRNVVSNHFNHMVRNCDSVDEYFNIEKKYNNQIKYSRIQSQISLWRFNEATAFLRQSRTKFRAADWFYSMGQVLRFKMLLPIDIDSLIECMRKMRITSYHSPTFESMASLQRIINQGSATEQLIQCLRPTLIRYKQSFRIKNQAVMSYHPKEIRLKQSQDLHYSKYQNNSIVQIKNIELAINQQKLILKTLCLWTRLIQELLKLNLEEDFLNYPLIQELNIVREFIPKLLSKQNLLKYQVTYIEQREQTKININLPSVLVSLLDLYNLTPKLPPNIYALPHHLFALLPQIQLESENNFAYQNKYTNKTFTFRGFFQREPFYEFYKDELQYLTLKFFESVLYEMTDLSFENDETSLKSTILSIVQLMIENQSGKLLVQCLENYTYPVSGEQEFTGYSLISKYLFKDNSKNMIPTLFYHISTILPGQNMVLAKTNMEKLTNTIRAIQSLCFMLKQPLFAKQILSLLPSLRKEFIKLITIQEIYTKKCPKSKQIDLLNKIALFLFRLLQTTKSTLAAQQFNNLIIENFLIHPENMLRMFFQRMTKIMPDYNQIDKMILINRQDDPLSNYLMQVNVTRNAIYRVTYNILIRVFFIVLQNLKKQNLAQILLHLLIKNSQLILNKPRQLDLQPLILQELKLIPSETIFITTESNSNIPIITMSEDVTEFKYCYRTNFRKYGPNFLYNCQLAFHTLKHSIQNRTYSKNSQAKSPSKIKQIIRKDIYLVQLINCVKSLNFSYQSLVKCYFQVMQLLTNTGPVGQNLTISHLDKSLPRVYETQMFMNRYCLQNKFSFSQSLHIVKNMLTDEPIVICITRMLEEFCYLAKKRQTKLQILVSQEEREAKVRGIPKNVLSPIDYLQTKTSECLNPDQVIKLIQNIMVSLIQHFSPHQSLRQSCTRYTRFLHIFHEVFYRVSCTFRVLLQSYASILAQYDSILALQSSYINQQAQTLSASSYPYRTHQKEISIKEQQQGVNRKRQVYTKMQAKMLEQIARVLFVCYEREKPTMYLPQIELKCQRKETCVQESIASMYNLKEVEDNIALVCSVCTQILSELPEDVKLGGFLSEQSQYLLTQQKILKSINYILKLLTENTSQIQNPIARITIFSLCNKFYLINSETEIQKWQYFEQQYLFCQEIMLKQPKQEDPQFLERIEVFDTLCVFAILNQKSFDRQLLMLLVEVVNLNENFIREQKTLGSKRYQTTKTYSLSLTNGGIGDQIPRKRYNFRHQENQNLSIDKILEYKKLLMVILLACTEDNWNNLNYSPQMNALFLEISRFEVIDFNLDRLKPLRPVQQRLSGLIICEEVAQRPFLNKNKQKRQQGRLLLKDTSSYSAQAKISLLNFIAFVHHNELIYNYLLILKTGVQKSKIMVQIGGYILEIDEYNQIWNNLYQKIIALYQYYSNHTETFLQNPRLIANLTHLYNYVAEEPSYLMQFDALTIFFDKIDPSYVKTQLVNSIVEYCTTVLELSNKWRQMEWKGKQKWSLERMTCLNRCLQLLQKNKVINGFKQLGLFQETYAYLRKKLTEQISREKNSSKQKELDQTLRRY